MKSCEKFKQIDIYGRPIEMTYNGRRRYVTVCGALATLLTAIIILYISISGYLFLDYIDSTFEMLKHSDIRDECNTPFNPKDAGFSIGLGYDDPNFDKYGRVRFSYVQWGWQDET